MLVPEDRKPTEFSMPGILIVSWAATGVRMKKKQITIMAPPRQDVRCRFIFSSVRFDAPQSRWFREPRMPMIWAGQGVVATLRRLKSDSENRELNWRRKSLGTFRRDRHHRWKGMFIQPGRRSNVSDWQTMNPAFRNLRNPRFKCLVL